MFLHLNSFKPNWWAVGLGVTFLITFIIYFAGFTAFNKTYRPLFYEGESDPLKNIKWFLVSWPIVGFMLSLGLVAIASLEWRQVLLAVRFKLARLLAGLIMSLSRRLPPLYAQY